MKSICGANCTECEYSKNKCKGCYETKGCPFDKQCFIADYILVGGKENYKEFKDNLIEEVNSLNIEGMPKIKELYPLKGEFVNLDYILPNGRKVRLLDDCDIYLGNQVECEFNDEENKTCFGIVANMDFILICEYGEDGINPEIVIYKRR